MKRLKTLSLLIFLSTSLFSKSHEIKWELENPFRFFKEPKVYKIMQELYQDANQSGCLFERLLQEKKDKLKLMDGNKIVKNRGWAHYFGNDFIDKTYWNINAMKYEEGYTTIPKNHEILLSVSNMDSNKSCQWTINQKPIESKNCKEVPFVISNKEEYEIKVTWDSGYDDETIKKIENILIVGLGDSFGSGEGNPDIPIKTDNMRENFDRIFTENRYLPRKEDGDYAMWLDRRAHRSLYSYQFKTALHYSLKNPKKSVTFVSFSSSGAVTDNIIDTPKNSVEDSDIIIDRWENTLTHLELMQGKKDNSIDRRQYILPQLKLLKKTLKDRKADIILLSIGGNDIGFVEYVQNIALKGKLRQKVKEPTAKTEYKIDNILFNNYYRLSNFLKPYVKNNDSKRVLLTAYPNILKDENAHLCKGDRRSMLIPFGYTEKRKQRIEDTNKYLIEPLYKIQKKLAKELGWSFIDGHREAFEKHGFCARDENTFSVQEQFVMPYKKKKEERFWIPFNPKEYSAYGKKERWVQLPVDSVLMINLTEDFLWFQTDFLFSDETSGIFHPTAEGLSVTADENLKVMEKILEN